MLLLIRTINKWHTHDHMSNYKASLGSFTSTACLYVTLMIQCVYSNSDSGVTKWSSTSWLSANSHKSLWYWHSSLQLVAVHWGENFTIDHRFVNYKYALLRYSSKAMLWSSNESSARLYQVNLLHNYNSKNLKL